MTEWWWLRASVHTQNWRKIMTLIMSVKKRQVPGAHMHPKLPCFALVFYIAHLVPIIIDPKVSFSSWFSETSSLPGPSQNVSWNRVRNSHLWALLAWAKPCVSRESMKTRETFFQAKSSAYVYTSRLSFVNERTRAFFPLKSTPPSPLTTKELPWLTAWKITSLSH